jgi:hypothetical protein
MYCVKEKYWTSKTLNPKGLLMYWKLLCKLNSIVINTRKAGFE